MAPKIRKLGDPRVETIVVTLTDAEIQDQRAKACELRDQQDALKRERSGAMAQFKARAQALGDAESSVRLEVSTGKRQVDVAVQDYLTPQNEVVTMSGDGVVLAKRTATADELQGGLFGDDDEDGFGQPS